ncbi:MAG: ATP-binding cassette domain-containing protein, partial [Mariprofundales bacterium]|nr:ATP-binding cassette domain-containing protein [Mariprofundales bacterium]
GERFAVRDLSFSIHKGEVMGLLGPNGAGKSTTMKMLACYLPPSSGEAWIGGRPLSESTAVRRQIGYLPENAPLWSELSVYDHLQFMGKMQQLHGSTLQERIRTMAQLCHIESVMQRRIDELSKGFRQRVGLAGSMLHDPDLLILDEPTTGLDPNQIVEIRQLIRRLAEHKTVLLSSHILAEVEAVCDRMMIIDRSTLKAIGSASELAALASDKKRLHAVACDTDPTQLHEQLAASQADIDIKITSCSDGRLTIELTASEGDTPLAATLFRAVAAQSGVLLELRPERVSLEGVFHRLTGEVEQS